MTGVKLFFMTFGAVFLAELADKTQLVSIGMSSKFGRPVTVWLASVLAYMIITLIAVYIGAALGKHCKPELIRYGSGLLFIIIGVLIVASKG
ncbi:MAG: TMEM165/GDT1 family protein [Candidatus Omnitrophica bacterium]|nr:TMEM165/GDT1 family protein [Candidatus Omnitrophota bacterium]